MSGSLRRPTRWGILSTGTIAQVFAQALIDTPRHRLLGVASRTPQRAADFRQSLGAAHPGCRDYGGYEALLAQPDIDAVYVATPHPQHARWVIAALKAGKAVLAEKPLGVNHAEVMAMVDTAEQSGRLLMEAFMYRCHPQTQAIREAVTAGAIGELRHIDGQFGFHASFDPEHRLFNNALAGGGILDVGCYPMSAARHFFGAEPIRISGAGHLGATGVDEWASALLYFPGNRTAQISTAVSLNLRNHLILYGDRGRIEVRNPWHCADADGRWSFLLHTDDGTRQIIEGQADPLYRIEADHVADLLDAGSCESPWMNWQDSLGNAAALDAWRAALGLVYSQEQPDRHPGPVGGQPPRPQPGAPIPQRRIQGLNRTVSRLVMGCDNQPGMPHAAVMWDHFFELGGNAFDTAHLYGNGAMETLLGHWHQSRGLRDEIVIIGKGAHTPDNYPEMIARQLDESLERLQTDRVDVYFLHRDNPGIPVDEFVSALNDEQQRGRIGVFGGSNWSLNRVRAANDYAAANGLAGFRALSNQLSLARMVEPIWPGVESAKSPDYAAYLESEDIALMPWSAQARGFFTDWATRVRDSLESDRAATTRMEPDATELRRTWFAEDNFERRRRAELLAQERNLNLISIALAYVLAAPFPCFPLIGPRSLRETRSSLASLTVTLSDVERRWLDLEIDSR